MKAFRFSLDRVLQWRETQLELERVAGERLVQQRVEIDNCSRLLTEARAGEERAIVDAPELESGPLISMSGFQVRVEKEKSALAGRRVDLNGAIALQLSKTMEAHRRVRLLERLRDRRKAQWTTEWQAEEERFASEAWLARLR
jgi:hypothetical protein